MEIKVGDRVKFVDNGRWLPEWKRVLVDGNVIATAKKITRGSIRVKFDRPIMIDSEEWRTAGISPDSVVKATLEVDDEGNMY